MSLQDLMARLTERPAVVPAYFFLAARQLACHHRGHAQIMEEELETKAKSLGRQANRE
jgi:hypothetical protein